MRLTRSQARGLPRRRAGKARRWKLGLLAATAALSIAGAALWLLQPAGVPADPGARAAGSALAADDVARGEPPSVPLAAGEPVEPQEVVARDHVATDNDLEGEDVCEEAVEPPFEGPRSNNLLGTGGGAGGWGRSRHGGGGLARVAAGGPGAGAEEGEAEPLGTESYAPVDEEGFLRVADRPLSTFSVDVDSASYANVRRLLNDGVRPPRGAVRVEELVNYFSYADAAPADGRPFAVHTEIASCPWAPAHRLVRIALKAREVDRRARPASNLVFLVDVSGSMDAPNKLPLVKASLRMLLDELSERDHVAIVTYAGESGLALSSTSCEQKLVIAEAIDRLATGGTTNGASGITLANDVANRQFVPGSINRVVLMTDGDFNVGLTSHEALWGLIGERARTGVFLSVLGFGMGNYKDDMLEQLADRGNGNYGYIDSTREAHRVLVEQAGGTLVAVAKDAKIQVEWNPAVVAGYRLVGYENRRLADRDFRDDAKDAGDIGAGHSVVALYEVRPALPVAAPGSGEIEPLKYQRAAPAPSPAPAPAPAPGAGEPAVSAEMLTVKVRWKEPSAAASQGLERAATDAGRSWTQASADYRFSTAVAAFALLLRGSAHKGEATWDSVLALAREALGTDPGGYRREFLDLVERARLLSPP